MKKSYCLRIPEDLKLLAVMRARELNMSFSDFVTLAIRKMILEDYHGGSERIDQAIQIISQTRKYENEASGGLGE